MAALSAITPAVTGTVIAGSAVSSSDTIDQSLLGSRGAYLIIINGNASSDTVTIKDFGSTRAGHPLSSNQFTVSVANGTSKAIWIKPSQVDPASGLVTVTHSVTSSVTYQLVAVQ